MIIPVRCFSCGKTISQYWEEYKERVAKGESPKKILDSLGIERYCCRGVFIGHVELIDAAGEFMKG